MSMTKCQECKHVISTSAKTCPQCGAKQKKAVGPVGLTIAGLLLVGFVWSLAIEPSSGPAASDRPVDTRLQEDTALDMCINVIRRVSVDPEKARIPRVAHFGDQDDTEFYFAWNQDSRMLRMRNRMGLEVAGTAACIVDREQRRIVHLSINGQTII